MKIKVLSLAAIAAIMFSCSSDDDNNTSDPVGLYTISAFTITEPQDLNGDGVSSSNILTETHCFDGGFIQLNADHTFTASSDGMEITMTTGGVEEVSCYDDGNFPGTWTVSGNLVTLTYMDEGTQYSDSFTISNNSITISVQDGEVVGMSGGNPVYVTTDISMVYTKQ